MAREYGRMFGTFWTSETIRAMSDDGKLLAAYLLSCSHNTIAGVFRAPRERSVTDVATWNGLLDRRDAKLKRALDGAPQGTQR